MASFARLSLAVSAAILCAAQENNRPPSADVAKAIEAVNRELDAAQQRRDHSATARLIADPFILNHAGGAFDSRSVFLGRIASGRVRSPADDVSEFDVSIIKYGEHTAIRRSRVRRRLVQQKRETWILETKVFVQQNGNWLLASSQGSRLHEGSIEDASKYQHLAGQYVSDSGKKLTVTWTGYGFFVHWPDLDTTSQVFPVSSADLADDLRRLHFTFDTDGKVIAAAEFRHRPLPPPVTGTAGTWSGKRVNE